QATSRGAQRSLMCFDRADGKMRWTKAVETRPDELTHKTNPYCASSATTDGRAVYVWHGSAGAFAYDFSGRELWRRDLGTFTHIWGYASSPVLYGDNVIISAGPGLNVFLIALDKKTGQVAWKTPLPAATSREAKQFKGSWSTPVLRRANGRDELILSLPGRVVGFDPGTGEELWHCDGLTDLAYTSPLVGPDGHVVAMSGYGGAALGLDARGDGDLTSRRLWLVPNKKNPQRVGSGVIVGDHIYILNAPGVAHCIELKTGRIVWQQRLGKRSSSWSSMVHADGHLYVNDMQGDTYILDPSPTYRLVRTNPIGEMTRASLAFSDGQVFIRTYEHLYCIGPRRGQGG
ncbi:MAG: PQQ-binding-like beta-propeller repeat protein, partial [Phycisphaerae bacterium]|nr:PQQ-binding-like beta-propeller repeat protein [Phycisphaerae bacterium]